MKENIMGSNHISTKCAKSINKNLSSQYFLPIYQNNNTHVKNNPTTTSSYALNFAPPLNTNMCEHMLCFAGLMFLSAAAYRIMHIRAHFNLQAIPIVLRSGKNGGTYLQSSQPFMLMMNEKDHFKKRLNDLKKEYRKYDNMFSPLTPNENQTRASLFNKIENLIAFLTGRNKKWN